jgi:hypothetical protein
VEADVDVVVDEEFPLEVPHAATNAARSTVEARTMTRL